MRAAVFLVAGMLLAGCTPTISQEDPEVASVIDDDVVAVSALRDRVVNEALMGSLPSGSQLVGRSVSTQCRRGQHNLFVDDSYDLACATWADAYIAVPTDKQFAMQMERVHAALQQLGLTSRFPASEEIPRELDHGLVEVVDDYAGNFGSLMRQGLPGQSEVPYGPQHLPGASYLVDGEVGTRRLVIGLGFTGPDDRYLHSNEQVAVITPDDRRLSGADLVKLFPPGGYGLRVGVSVTSSFSS